MRLIIITFLSGIAIHCVAQQTLQIKVKDAKNRAPVSASLLIKGTARGYTTDTAGIASISFLNNCRYNLLSSAAGYEEQEIKLNIPHISKTIEIELDQVEQEMQEVIVQSTRTGRTIANVPTRIET